MDVAVSPDGSVYVADKDNHRIQKCDSDGNFITKWGSQGSGDGQFQGAEGITADASGNVYEFDSSSNRIQKFDTDGNYITEWGGSGNSAAEFNRPMGMAVDANGDIYIADSRNNRAQKFSPNGSYIRQFALGDGDDSTRDPLLYQPYSVSITTWRTKYVVEVGESYSVKIYAPGESLGIQRVLTNLGGGVTLKDPKGMVTVVSPSPSGYTHLYLVDSGNNRILKINVDESDTDWSLLMEWGSSGSGNGQFSSPIGIARDSSGNVFVADTGNHRIQKFDSDGNFINGWGSQGSGDGQFSSPQGIAVDGTVVYVADTGNDRIQAFTIYGDFMSKLGGSGAGQGLFKKPVGVSVDYSDAIDPCSLYVVDASDGRVQKFVPGYNR
jgi:sugar lactone lactonase YvrE